MECVTMNTVKPKVLALGMHPIDVEPIPHRNRNNSEVHLDYLKHLKESVETLREIVEEAKIEKPLDNWKPTRRKFTLGEQCPLTRFTKFKVVPLQQPKHASTSELVITERFSNTTQKPLSRTPTKIGDPTYQTLHLRLFSNAGRTDRLVVFGLMLLKTYNEESRTAQEFHDHFGAIMGYGDYVIGDNLEVAFRKHSCYVRDVDGVELLKGSCGSNLYTIFVEDMIKSSPICLLSKAFKNKSWLRHHQLNHLHFGTINDLARKDLVRGLPRLKFEKDHLCSACQLGKSKKYTHKPKYEYTIMAVLHTLQMDLCRPMRVQSINGKKYILVEAIATACYTQNRSLIHTHHNKTPYEVVQGNKPDLTFLCIFSALCYPTNDNEYLRKLKAKAKY
ncbi:retrovirus-related pol polyprotein from transposon TNT 1-94 [Tanacetum coccineum]